MCVRKFYVHEFTVLQSLSCSESSVSKFSNLKRSVSKILGNAIIRVAIQKVIYFWN